MPFGEEAATGWSAGLREARPALLGQRQTDALFVTSAGRTPGNGHVARDVLELAGATRAAPA